MAAIPAAYWIMAAGTAAKMAGDRQQQKQQRSIINRALDQTAKTQGATQQMIAQEGANYSGDARAQAMQGQEDAAFAQAQQDVQGAALPQAGAGRMSGDYLRAQASKTATEGERLTSIAREAAKLRSPGRLLQDEGARSADTLGRVGSALGTDANMARAAQTDAASVQAPAYGQLGGLAATIAGMYAGGAGGATGGATNYALPAGAALGQQASNSSLFTPAKTFLNPGGARIRFGGT
jgi:hypothetical protein